MARKSVYAKQTEEKMAKVVEHFEEELKSKNR